MIIPRIRQLADDVNPNAPFDHLVGAAVQASAQTG